MFTELYNISKNKHNATAGTRLNVTKFMGAKPLTKTSAAGSQYMDRPLNKVSKAVSVLS
jgi:hypothetical protein